MSVCGCGEAATAFAATALLDPHPPASPNCSGLKVLLASSQFAVRHAAAAASIVLRRHLQPALRMPPALAPGAATTKPLLPFVAAQALEDHASMRLLRPLFVLAWLGLRQAALFCFALLAALITVPPTMGLSLVVVWPIYIYYALFLLADDLEGL